MNLLRSATSILPLAAVALAVSPAARAQCSRADDELLHSAQPQLSGRLGWSLALDADVLISGAIGEGNLFGGLYDGAATVWRKSAGNWIEEQRLPRPASVPQGAFGSKVALAGDVAAVVNLAGVANSRVVTYRFGGVQWNEEDTLAASTGTTGGFGRSLALSGDTLLIGCDAAQPVVPGPSSGSVAVYRHNGASWLPEAILAPPAATATEAFGWSVALDGDVALVGAMRKNGNTGTGYVFRRAGTTWSFEAELAPSATTQWCGNSCALQGDVAVLGTYNDTADAVGAGKAIVWRRVAGTWLLDQELRPLDPVSGMRFGAAVAIDGNRIAVCGLNNASGYLYEHRNGAWRFLSKLDTGGANGFGSTNYLGALSLSNGVVALGAPGANGQFAGEGTVIVYDTAAIATVCTYCTAKADSAGCTPQLQFSGTPSASAASGFSIVAGPVANQRLGMLMFSLQGPQALAFSGGTICLRTPQRTTVPQNSGGSPSAVDDCTGAFGLDFNAWRASKPHPLMVAGRQVFAQYWYRDDGTSTGLSDAIQFLLEP